MAYKMGKGPDANYNFKSQVAPKKRMGGASFANLPDAPMIRSFDPEHDYRDGLVNRFTSGVDMFSEVEENGC